MKHEDAAGLQLHDAYHYVQSSDPGAVGAGKNWLDTTGAGPWTLKRRNAANSAWVVVGQSGGSIDHGTLSGLADDDHPQYATVTYVDGLVTGLSWKQPVRAASTANVTLATAVENGDTLDGVVLATNDRILLKNQTAGEENGIYVVAASGAPARASDANTAAEILQASVFVQEGTVNADTNWILTTNAPITLGTTSLTFSQFGVGGGSALTVQEVDGTPSDSAVTIIRVTNGKMTDNGAGDVTLDLSGNAGAMELIQDTLVGVGGVVDISVTIPAGYKHLMIIGNGRGDTAATEIGVHLQFNGDTGNNYDDSLEAAFTNNTRVGGGAVAGSNIDISNFTGSTAGAGRAMGFTAHVHNHAGTVFNKTVDSISRYQPGDATNTTGVRMWSGLWRSTAAITSLRIFPSSGNFIEGTRVTVYGLK